MWGFICGVKSLLYYEFIKVLDNMIKVSIYLAIGLRLPSIKLLVIFIKHMRHSYFASWYFQILCSLFVPNNHKTVFLWRGQIFILAELLFCNWKIRFRITGWECVKRVWLFILGGWFLWDISADDVLVFLYYF